MTDRRIHFDAARAAEYELILKVGDPILPDGQTRVRLRGDGTFFAEQVSERPETRDSRIGAAKGTGEGRAEGSLAAEQAQDLLRRASQFPWHRTFPSRPGIPDEAIVVWEFGRKGEQSLSLKVWLREAEDDPVLAPVLRALREGLARFSENRLYL